MAAKGTLAKSQILQKIKEIYPDAFEMGKDLRIPLEENGEQVEIKISMTCAKDLMAATPAQGESNEDQKKTEVAFADVTQTQKEDVSNMLKALGF